VGEFTSDKEPWLDRMVLFTESTLAGIEDCITILWLEKMYIYLCELVNNPSICFMLGLSFGFFVRHRVAKKDEEFQKVYRECIVDIYKSIIKKHKIQE
jgi:hypothetical protein